MATHRKRRAALALAAGLLAARALGCGGSFDEAPPTLPLYLHRLPAKSLEQIYGETTTPREKCGGDYRQQIERLPERLQREQRADLLADVDRLLEQARCDPESRGALFNLLHDLRAALSIGDAPTAELAAYLRWRFEHRAWLGFYGQGEEPSYRERGVPDGGFAEIEKQLAAASPPLRAQWIYLRGAVGFKGGEDTESQQWFARVVEEFPGHPRAEAALFMVARCQLSRSRTYGYSDAAIAAAAANRPRALELFTQYLQKYPHGAFAADALGWLGAIAYDDGEYAKALPFYIQQTELPEHPELRRSALVMCERVLSRIASTPDEAALSKVAAHPRLAMGLIYLIVNSTEAHNFDGHVDEVAAVRSWRKEILPRLAAAVAAQEERYLATVWQPRYLAILAFAASGAGEQEQALKLAGAAADRPDWSDDLAFVRAVALQRAGRLAQAIVAYRRFLEDFAASPLARGARLRLALALLDNREAGAAIVELQKLLPEPEIAREEYRVEPVAESSAAEPAQVKQLIDTLRNFAPLPQLAAAFEKGDLDAARRIDFYELLAQRHLAREQFAKARKYVPPAHWELGAADLEALTREAAAAPAGTARAEAALRTAEAWASMRGKLLTLPLDSQKARSEIFRDEHALANVKRMANARALGVASEAEAELELRDELQHAYAWWLRAHEAAAAGSPVGAKALWRALEAMPKIANVSPFTRSRAAATDAGARSRELYQALQRKYPRSPEATKYAAYWSFPEANPGSYLWWDTDGATGANLAEALRPGSVTSYDAHRQERWKEIIARIFALKDRAAEWELPQFKAEIAELREQAKEVHRTPNESFVLNFLDDLSTFAEEPDTGAEVRRRYVALRLQTMRQSAWGDAPPLPPNPIPAFDTAGNPINRDAILREKIAAALADPAMQPVRDYLQFLDLAVVANHQIQLPFPGIPEKDGEPYTYGTRDYPLLEKLTAEFLARHPRSRKREAAMLLHARAIYMRSKPATASVEAEWPESGRWGYTLVTRYHQREPFEPERITKALDAYEQEYPGGRYAADIRSIRAAVALRQQRWRTALDLTMAQWEDEQNPSLHLEAAARLVEIFEHLKEPEQRSAILTAVKTNAPASRALEASLALEGADHPLRYLRQYVLDQLAEARATAAAPVHVAN